MIAGQGRLLTATQSARLAILDSMDRDRVIEMIARGLQSSNRVCELHKFGGSSPDVLWRLLNGIAPGPHRR
jgi:hypothetical protein